MCLLLVLTTPIVSYDSRPPGSRALSLSRIGSRSPQGGCGVGVGVGLHFCGAALLLLLLLLLRLQAGLTCMILCLYFAAPHPFHPT